jgi:hypothetical protein
MRDDAFELTESIQLNLQVVNFYPDSRYAQKAETMEP